MTADIATTRIATVISLCAAVLIAAHLAWPDKAIDSITVSLLIVAILPWLLPFIKSIEFPGGVKIELQKVKTAINKIMSISSSDKAPGRNFFSPESVCLNRKDGSWDPTEGIDYNPALELIAFRIELEKRLRHIAESHGMGSEARSLLHLVKDLQSREVFTKENTAGIFDIIDLGNKAAHGVPVSPDVADWVKKLGPSVLNMLDILANKPQTKD